MSDKSKNYLLKALFCMAAAFFSTASKSQEQSETKKPLTVALAPIVFQDEAYRTPDMTAAHSRGLIESGVTDALLWAVVDTVKAEHYRSKYNTINSEKYTQLKEALEKNIKLNIQSNLIGHLKTNRLSKGFISSSKPENLLLTIEEYGLRRSDDSEIANASLAVFVKSNLKITDSNNNVITTKNYKTYTHKAGTLDSYLADTAFLSDVIRETHEKIANQIAVDLYVLSMKK